MQTVIQISLLNSLTQESKLYNTVSNVVPVVEVAHLEEELRTK